MLIFLTPQRAFNRFSLESFQSPVDS